MVCAVAAILVHNRFLTAKWRLAVQVGKRSRCVRFRMFRESDAPFWLDPDHLALGEVVHARRERLAVNLLHTWGRLTLPAYCLAFLARPVCGEKHSEFLRHTLLIFGCSQTVAFPFGFFAFPLLVLTACSLLKLVCRGSYSILHRPSVQGLSKVSLSKRVMGDEMEKSRIRR